MGIGGDLGVLVGRSAIEFEGCQLITVDSFLWQDLDRIDDVRERLETFLVPAL